MKKTICMLLITVLAAATLVACGNHSAPGNSTNTPPDSPGASNPAPVTGESDGLNLADIKIGVTLVNIVEPFFADIKTSLEENAAAAGIGRIDIQDGQNDPAKQLSQVEDFIAQGFDVVFINPVEAQSLVSAAEACKKAGVICFTIDRMLETDYGPDGNVLSHIGASAEDGGIIGMQIVVDELIARKGQAEGTVIYLTGTPGSSTAADRTTGVNITLEKYPDVTIVTDQPAESKEDGLEVTENLMQLYPDVDAIYAYGGDGALGALKALENIGNTTTFVVGTGGEVTQYNEIANGSQLIGTVDFSGVTHGVDAINAAVSALNGEELPEWIVAAATPVTAENVKDFLA